jgi:hypothetical protein
MTSTFTDNELQRLDEQYVLADTLADLDRWADDGGNHYAENKG